MIHLEGLRKTYTMGSTQIIALNDIDLTINAGDYVAVMGSSGSGKSTLLNILGCLDTFEAGRYRLNGTEVQQFDDDQLAAIRNREIGFIFQNFNLLPRKSALRNAALPLLYRRDEAVNWDLAAEMLRKVGLGDRLHHRPMELSGGQRQRVAIARALINQPAILLADEPTGNLDSKTSSEIMELFRELNQGGHTIVMVTHEEDITAYAQRVIRLKDGVIIEDTGSNP